MNCSRIMALLPIALLVGCATGPAITAAPEDQLIGCYAQISADDEVSIRVLEDEAGYLLVALDNVAQHDPMRLKPMDMAVIAANPKLAGRVDAMLVSSSAALGVVKVREGAVFEGLTRDSDYYLAAPMVGGPLFKRECP